MATVDGVATFRAFGCATTLAVADPAAITGARRRLERIIDSVDLAASRFRPDSEITRVGRAGGAPVAVSPLFVSMLRAALDAAACTDGLVDPTVGASLRAAGYDRPLADLAELGLGARPTDISPIPASGWQRVDLDDRRQVVRIPAGTELDLGATGKAYAADLAARDLSAALGCGVLVAFGGDVAVGGAAPPGGWAIRVAEDPDRSRPMDEIIGVSAGGVATSSTLRRRWQLGTRRVHHILDPATGLPAAVVWRTVTVAAASCVDANTASTAAVVLGDDAPDWLAVRRLPARLVRRDGTLCRVADWPVAAGADADEAIA